MKAFCCRGMLRLSETMLREARTKRQILTAPKFAFLLKEYTRINAVRGWKD
jgi:hypothetical protein